MVQSKLLLALGAIAAQAANFANIEDGTDEFQVLTASGNSLSWTAAAAACDAAGMVIASLHSDEDYQSMKAACTAACDTQSSDCGCWIGAKQDNNVLSEGAWYNADNTFADYLILGGSATGVDPWYTNEPNNAGNEDCAHIWRPQNYWINDINCADSGNYPLCRVIDGSARKCAPGYDNDAETGECSIPLVCAGRNGGVDHLIGDNSGLNDIGGCGIQGNCALRYDLDTVDECNERCQNTDECVAYTWTPYSGDKNHPGKKTCTVYNSVTPTQHWDTNQIMCRVCPQQYRAESAVELGDVAQIAEPAKDAVKAADDTKTMSWMVELLALNAAVSALVSVAVVGMCFGCYFMCRGGRTVQYEKVVEEDV